MTDIEKYAETASKLERQRQFNEASIYWKKAVEQATARQDKAWYQIRHRFCAKQREKL
ncbi:ANR family transcriptional regulator [Vibrio sp. McD22-P3]|uniref:ANR family transcriptional regulator n=1 Tax=Vibrio sp. McD22-P3 TaxID=2724880 RepID=UPI001F489035|nr:ANR family transcriptional regulator [Vibrio sp. McD22-P3]MCF4172688.1 ANR family transcriptional regulator [Vibrio sp. McD22-P3]